MACSGPGDTAYGPPGALYEEPAPPHAVAPRRALSASESAMQSYALPVIIAMLAILVAFSWLG